jgi:dTDP-4-amino-4,6-dideoxygalactose transaminase
MKIPFNKPVFQGNELTYIQEALQSGHVSGDGTFTKRCHSFLEEQMGIPKALLTVSCTAALEMSALLLDLEPGDEVIMPTFTFVSTANAYVLRGAKPVFVDSCPRTLNIDAHLIEKKITSKTKAIVVVHYGGIGCDMDEICALAEKYGLQVIEDNAHGLFGKYKDKYLGTFGCLATQSFHETKNFTCGEGGALLINDKKMIARAEIIREKGTNRSQFFRGQVDKYSWVDVGSSFLPSDIQAAFLLAQFEAHESIQQKRKSIWEFYLRSLGEWAAKVGARLPIVPEYCEQSYHLFYLLLPTLDFRTQLISRLKEAGIIGVFHYVPLHTSVMGKKFGYKVGDCPVAEDASDRLLRLPFYNDLNEDQQIKVIETILKST